MPTDTHGVRERMVVWSRDGARVGRVLACAEDRFELERGFFFPKDYVVPLELVARVDAAGVTLHFTRAELEAEWAQLDLYGRGERGFDTPGHKVGVEAPGALGEQGPADAFPDEQAPELRDDAPRLVSRPDGVAVDVRIERREAGAPRARPPAEDA